MLRGLLLLRFFSTQFEAEIDCLITVGASFVKAKPIRTLYSFLEELIVRILDIQCLV